MAVGTRGSAGGPHIADQLPLFHGLPGLHDKGRHVGVQRFVPVAVVDLHIVAPAHGGVVVPLGGNDRARVGGIDRRAVGGRDVHAAVSIGQTGPPADARIPRHRPEKAACAQPADHAAFQPRAAVDDLRHGGLHKLHIHHAGADDLARHGCDLAGDKLAAVLPGLYGLGFAKIQPRVLDSLGLKRQLPGHGLVPHGLDLQKVVRPQCGGQVAVRCDGRGRVDAVHQPQGVDKVGLHTVGLPRRTHSVQKLPQVVALVGDEPQCAVQIDGGALGDLAACGAQDGIGGLALGHGAGVGVGHDKGVRGLDVPADHAGQAGLYVGAGCVERLLVCDIAHDLPADLDPQHKGPRQRGAHEPCQHPGGQQRHGVPRQLPRMGERCFKAARRPHCGPQHHSQQRKQRPRRAVCQRRQPASNAHRGVFHMEACVV